MDSIFQLVDEIYRGYMKEAREDFELGDLSRANIKEEFANEIHSELKRIYKSTFKDDHSIRKQQLFGSILDGNVLTQSRDRTNCHRSLCLLF